MGSWLDLVNAGLNVAHSHQIRQAQEQLQAMEADAAEAALRAHILEIMRNYVFEISQDIRALDEHLQTAPQQVYVIAHALRWRIQELGITPEIFPEFADKEYVQQTQTKIKDAIQQSQSLMPPEQRAQADKAVKFVEQSALLQKAIDAMSAKEKLADTEQEWAALSQKAKRAKNNKTLGCLALVGTFLIVPAISDVISALMASISEFLGGLTMLISLVVWVGGMIGSIVLLAKQSKPEGYEQLKETRETWKSELLPNETWERVVSLWGKRTSQGYQEIQRSRNNFLSGMFGQVDGFDKFLPAGN
jgi:hypothetical protein